MHGSCSPAYMANTATNTWQPVCSSIKTLHSRLALTRQMRSTISAAHMLLAVGKFPKTIYDSLHTTTCTHFMLDFVHHHCYKSSFSSRAICHKNKCSALFVVKFFPYLVVLHVPILCDLSHQIDVLYLQSVKLATRRLPGYHHRNNL